MKLDLRRRAFWLCVLALWMPAAAWRNEKAIAVALAFVAALYAFFLVSFWVRANKARTLLCEHLGCREVERANRLVRSA